VPSLRSHDASLRPLWLRHAFTFNRTRMRESGDQEDLPALQTRAPQGRAAAAHITKATANRSQASLSLPYGNGDLKLTLGRERENAICDGY